MFILDRLHLQDALDILDIESSFWWTGVRFCLLHVVQIHAAEIKAAEAIKLNLNGKMSTAFVVKDKSSVGIIRRWWTLQVHSNCIMA